MSDFLEVRSLTKSFLSGDSCLEVLRGLDLDLSAGTMLAVTGESGSGKSTLLHLLGGMEPADGGTILLDGTSILSLEGDELAEYRNRTIGFVFQFHHLLPEFTAVENVMFPLLLRRVSRREAEERARGFLEEVGLSQRGHHRPGELSGGEQQRVAVARALAGRPRLLLADEPTGNLDDTTSRAVHELLLEIHERYRLTSIIVTHNPELAALCHRTLRMREGKLEE